MALKDIDRVGILIGVGILLMFLALCVPGCSGRLIGPAPAKSSIRDKTIKSTDFDEQGRPIRETVAADVRARSRSAEGATTASSIDTPGVGMNTAGGQEIDYGAIMRTRIMTIAGIGCLVVGFLCFALKGTFPVIPTSACWGFSGGGAAILILSGLTPLGNFAIALIAAGTAAFLFITSGSFSNFAAGRRAERAEVERLRNGNGHPPAQPPLVLVPQPVAPIPPPATPAGATTAPAA